MPEKGQFFKSNKSTKEKFEMEATKTEFNSIVTLPARFVSKLRYHLHKVKKVTVEEIYSAYFGDA